LKKKALVSTRAGLFMPACVLEETLKERERGARVKRRWERESDRMILECNRCGEMVVVLGREEDWYMEGYIFFECQCGQQLSTPPEPH
jgi:hypothetical protein